MIFLISTTYILIYEKKIGVFLDYFFFLLNNNPEVMIFIKKKFGFSQLINFIIKNSTF